MTPRKNIYVKDEDTQLWEKAEKLAGDSLSSLVTELVRGWVTEKEWRLNPKEFDRIEVEVQSDEGDIVRKAFKGKVLLQEFQSEWSDKEWNAGFANHSTWWAALTEKGAYVFWTTNDGMIEGTVFEVYDSTNEADRAEAIPTDVIAAAAAAAGDDYVQDLDI